MSSIEAVLHLTDGAISAANSIADDLSEVADQTDPIPWTDLPDGAIDLNIWRSSVETYVLTRENRFNVALRE
jgi:hypothetical protein